MASFQLCHFSINENPNILKSFAVGYLELQMNTLLINLEYVKLFILQFSHWINHSSITNVPFIIANNQGFTFKVRHVLLIFQMCPSCLFSTLKKFEDPLLQTGTRRTAEDRNKLYSMQFCVNIIQAEITFANSM